MDGVLVLHPTILSAPPLLIPPTLVPASPGWEVSGRDGAGSFALGLFMSGPHEDPDACSMSRLREGEDLALNEIMDRWQRRLTSYLIRLTGSEAVAIDLAQETFVRVYQNRVRYRPTGAFSTWLLPSLRIWRGSTSAGRSGTPPFRSMDLPKSDLPWRKPWPAPTMIRAPAWNAMKGRTPCAKPYQGSRAIFAKP